jgi:hypothetical protein
MEGHVISDLLLYRISCTGDHDKYDEIISPIIIIIIIIIIINRRTSKQTVPSSDERDKQIEKFLGFLQNL